MSLTLARVCGEWQLVSRNYELVSGNYKALGASGGKYKAQIVIFCILAAVNRFSRISRETKSRWGKLESHWRKLESRWRKQKAVEESRKLLKKLGSRWRRFSWISWKLESRWRKSNFVWGKSEYRRRKIPIFPRYSLVSDNFGVSFLTPDLLPRARMDLLDWFQLLIT
jgi:hypothetical protein